MKYIFTILSILFLLIFSLNIMIPKLCINCKYFITDNNNNKYGKCSLFPSEENDIYRLINGVQEVKNIDYHFCKITRESEHMCGPEGKMYKKKYTKKEI